MRKLAILNQKGGVGKTTTAVNLAAALSRAGQRVLLIDLDPQSHATLHVGASVGPTDPTVYDLFVNATPIAEIARDVGERLALIPSSVDLVGAELAIADRESRERILSRALEPFGDAFDWCIVDCAPSLGLLTVNALVLATDLVIPLQPHFLALQGMGRLLETVTAVREALNPRLRVLGVVMTMYERGLRLGQEVRSDVTGFFADAAAGDPWHGAQLFETNIRRNIKLAESPSFGKTVFDYAPESHGAEDFSALAREIAAMVERRERDAVHTASVEEIGLAPNVPGFERPVPEGIVTAAPDSAGRSASAGAARDPEAGAE